MMNWVSERRFLHFIEDIKKLFAYKTDYAKEVDIDNRISTDKFISPKFIDYVVRCALAYPVLTWGEEAKELARNTIGGVGKTDYATAEKGGVVKVYSGNGLSCDNGQLAIIKATNADIDGKARNSMPIVPSNLDYAVMKALTDSKNHVWTDEQKKAVRDMLGITSLFNSITDFEEVSF